MTSLLQDVRYGFRMLRKHKGFTAVAALTLALGIGVNTAMFSVLNTFLFRSLPYPQSSQLVRVFRTSPHSQSWPHNPGNFLTQRDRNMVFEKMAAYNYVSRSLVEQGQTAQRVSGLAGTADFLPAFGVAPALGRLFNPEEFEPGVDNVIVLSDRFWQSRFGGDESVVGRKVQLDGKTVNVVGVMPPGFDHPILWGQVDFWQPLAFTPEQKKTTANYLQSFARLKPGVSIKQAEQSMVTLVANINKEKSPNTQNPDSVRLELLQRSISDDIGRKVMWFTFGLAGFVLLIACANIANLQLVRTASRSRELAVRAALGAGRLRLLRQSLTESIVVALIGGLLSLGLALWGVKFISNQLFPTLPGAGVELDLKVFAFAFACSLLTGVLFGTMPAWFASRADINQAVRENARGTTAGRSQHRLRHVLIIGEVAFAMILLAAAGLFLRGLQRFISTDPGWSVDGLVTANMSLRGERYAKNAQRVAFFSELENRIKSLPGVQHFAISDSQAVYGFNSSDSFVIEGRPEQPPDQYPEVFIEPVSKDYFAAYGVQLLRGRTFNNADMGERPRVVIINDSMAQRFWPNENPIGQRISNPREKDWQEVVGVVRDMNSPGSLGEPYTRYQTFVPLAQWVPGSITIALRTEQSPEAVSNSLRNLVAGLDPALPVYRVRTARSAVDLGIGSISLLGNLLGAFATLGLVLAAIGIYGVISYVVVQRTGEFGIRMALGARGRDVQWLVLRKGAVVILIGAVIGAAGSYAVSKLLISLIPSLPTRDPITLVIMGFVLVVVALVACYLPARRATKVDPLVALRYE
ncbi:MAG TPA: ABC transporter permease [Pyrinomonadaceae bacterium]|jgi:predicted permease|nr:ABC transporter permease [Pyrinomonadaceae bacterium]